MASSDGVSFGDVYFYTRHTECAIFEMTDLSPIEHAFDKGQTKGRMTSTQQRQKTAAKRKPIHCCAQQVICEPSSLELKQNKQLIC